MPVRESRGATPDRLSEKELLSLRFWDLVHPNSRSILSEHGFSHILNGSGKGRHELNILTKRGEVRVWDTTIGKVGADGKHMALVTATDITKRGQSSTAQEQTDPRDPLTGLLNATQLQIAVRSEIKRSERNGRSFSLLLLKVQQAADNQGDEQLRSRTKAQCRLANLIGKVCRSGDTAFRNTDEEFVVLLPETPMAGVRQLSLRLGERLEAEESDPPLAVVGGLAVFPQDGPTFEHLLRATRRTIRKIGVRRTRQLIPSQQKVTAS